MAALNVTPHLLSPQRLASSKAHTSRFITASLPCNKFKNRLVNILPYESSRVCLQPIRGVEGSDYINASFIDGYRCLGPLGCGQCWVLMTGFGSVDGARLRVCWMSAQPCCSSSPWLHETRVFSSPVWL